jgi:hypothetical protein
MAPVMEKRKAYNILIWKSEVKRLCGRRIIRWEDIRIDLKETGWQCVCWIHLAQDMDWWQAPVNMIINTERLQFFKQLSEY